jgi:glycine/serine hydroxymethyltransferase
VAATQMGFNQQHMEVVASLIDTALKNMTSELVHNKIRKKAESLIFRVLDS